MYEKHETRQLASQATRSRCARRVVSVGRVGSSTYDCIWRLEAFSGPSGCLFMIR